MGRIYAFGEYGFKRRAHWVFWPSPSSGEIDQWVPLSLEFVWQNEVTELFAELTKFAAELSEAQWLLFSDSALEAVFRPFPIVFARMEALVWLCFGKSLGNSDIEGVVSKRTNKVQNWTSLPSYPEKMAGILKKEGFIWTPTHCYGPSSSLSNQAPPSYGFGSGPRIPFCVTVALWERVTPFSRLLF